MAESILPICLLLPNSVENTGNWREAMGNSNTESRQPKAESLVWLKERGDAFSLSSGRMCKVFINQM